ncbi:trypsin-like serine peptidase [Bacillus thuringiensis]|uniref:trypsin-like serine peptidase n=1 Tax=Bacillus thuringiensis TaxID=1428 RepID=UPI0021D69532|nr:serine protease [Bacillus thuringiensis]MCU7679254.1 serine protease [Bacillus thuringiensis]
MIKGTEYIQRFEGKIDSAKDMNITDLPKVLSGPQYPSYPQPYYDTNYPWRVVGRIICLILGGEDNHVVERKMGTATLVGRNFIVTAHHVLPWDNIYAGNTIILFEPAYSHGKALAESVVTEIAAVELFEPLYGYDYVICKLNTPLGDELGFMGAAHWNNFADDEEFTVLGYPDIVDKQSEQPCITYPTSVKFKMSYYPLSMLLYTNAITSPGSSGGPLVGFLDGNPYVVGISSLYFPPPYFVDSFSSIFISGDYLFYLIRWGRIKWDGDEGCTGAELPFIGCVPWNPPVIIPVKQIT